MPKKIQPDTPVAKGVIEGAGGIVQQKITDTLEKNYMPYAMSVIVSRAIPEIDGFKPSHRKLLYTLYKDGRLTGARTKSANIVGLTMKLNPHGEAAIYETMVRLSRGNEALLHPYVDSKGNFGKAYSRDMAYAASRYTEVKLSAICQELFRDIDKDTVDFVDNYDNTLKEPVLLPAMFPTVLVNANTGIAVGMASSICPFNLKEVCETTIGLIRDEQHDIHTTLLAPDFPGGGQILYRREDMETIFNTGRGGLRVRSRYAYDWQNNCIDITQIPPTTTIEAIVEKVVDLIKTGRVKEISDIRDETGIDGLKITIDLKRGVDADRLMARLYKMTPLEDSFSCNFNILVNGYPRVMGVREILREWIAFRIGCVRRRTQFELTRRQERLHLLRGLQCILLDIDKAVRIVRETEEEQEVVPNLMIGFGIDEIQAEYVAEIKLRHLNREFILKRTQDITRLEEEIAQLTAILESKLKIKGILIAELKEIAEKYGQPRKSLLLYEDHIEEVTEEESVPDYAVNFFFTKEGYFKKITPLSLRMGGEQKLKDGDEIDLAQEGQNNAELLFFSNQSQVYKSRANDFTDTKASVLGAYIPSELGFDPGELAIFMAVTTDYKGYMLFFFENGKIAKVDMAAYATKTNRKKLLKAYSDKSPIVRMFYITEDREFLVTSTNGRRLLVHSGSITPKTTKDTIGISAMTQKKNQRVMDVQLYEDGMLSRPHRYRTRSLPAVGSLPSAEEQGEQLEL